MQFILAEDEALRNNLLGIKVSDGKNSARDVKVYFGQPDMEIGTQTYPYITIDLINISEDLSRSMRGFAEYSDNTQLPPDLPPLASGHTYVTQMPIPIVLDYQVTSYARHPRHDREILNYLSFRKLPFRYGTLEIPQDNTLRRFYVTQTSKPDGTEDGKRLFRNVWTLRVESEIQPALFTDVQQVVTVNPVITTIEIDQPIIQPTQPVDNP